MSDVEPGDTVRLDSKPEYRNPFEVILEYDNGTIKLEDPFGYPVVSVDPDRVDPVTEGEE